MANYMGAPLGMHRVAGSFIYLIYLVRMFMCSIWVYALSVKNGY